jgi:hypothetical protein
MGRAGRQCPFGRMAIASRLTGSGLRNNDIFDYAIDAAA